MKHIRPNWIKTADQLPKKRGEYLVVTDLKNCYVAEFIPQREATEVLPAGWHIYPGLLGNVTHWAEIVMPE